MTEIQKSAVASSPEEAALIERVLKRARETTILSKADKKDVARLATELYRSCGFTNEDQLLDQLLQALRPQHRR